MKAGLLSIAALSAMAAAQPHIRHARFHEERGADVVTQYHTDVVTVEGPGPTIIVDQYGHTIDGAPASSAPPASSPAVANKLVDVQAAAVAPTTTAAPYSAPTTTSSPAPVYSSPSAASSANSASGSSPSGSYSGATGGSGSGLGVIYPYNNADGSCKSSAQVDQDLADLSSKGYTAIRLYDNGCSGVSLVMDSAAKLKTPMSVLLGAGVNSVSDLGALKTELSGIISAVNKRWSAVQAVTIGNELIQNGKASVDQISTAVKTAISMLQADGFTGSVSTVDTYGALTANPSMCNIGTGIIYANCHTFFTPNANPSQSGSIVVGWTQALSSLCGGKKVIVTEAGWPSQGNGNTNGVGVAGQSEQSAAISSLKSSFSTNMYLFEAYNDMTKTSNNPFGVEQYWGMYSTPSSG